MGWQEGVRHGRISVLRLEDGSTTDNEVGQTMPLANLCGTIRTHPEGLAYRHFAVRSVADRRHHVLRRPNDLFRRLAAALAKESRREDDIGQSPLSVFASSGTLLEWLDDCCHSTATTSGASAVVSDCAGCNMELQ